MYTYYTEIEHGKFKRKSGKSRKSGNVANTTQTAKNGERRLVEIEAQRKRLIIKAEV
jgi:hypothetical protein